ncbi:MAG: serine hydrolase domain-containing protein, partial [Gemmataceae bacterium]
MFRTALLASLLVATPVFADGLDKERLARIDDAVNASIKRGDCPGVVVLVVHGDEVVYRRAFGTRDDSSPMTADTVFDLASITKPVATATSVMVLIEQGKLRLSDQVAKHWPEFAANGKQDVTVEHCLLHTTGLTADNAIADYADGRATAFANIAALKLEAPAGTRFKYSDVGFLVLGELVKRLGGMPLNEFAKKHVFDPLKMVDS